MIQLPGHKFNGDLDVEQEGLPRTRLYPKIDQEDEEQRCGDQARIYGDKKGFSSKRSTEDSGSFGRHPETDMCARS